MTTSRLRRWAAYAALLVQSGVAVAQQDEGPPPIVATNAFYYYHDVDEAWRFYGEVLGFETVVDYGFAKILRLADASYLTVVRAAEGMHSADEVKSVTLRLLTGEPGTWRTRLEAGGIPIDDTIAGRFSAIDPNGYRLEFVGVEPGDPGIRATVFAIPYDDAWQAQAFFNSLFDIRPSRFAYLPGDPALPHYRMSATGYVAVEANSGDSIASPGENGMTMSFFTPDVDAWFERASNWPGFRLRTEEVLNEGGLVRVFVGYDPAGVFLEWDTFFSVPENRELTKYLER